MPSRPASEYTATTHGDVYAPPAGRLSSPGARSSPPPSVAGPRADRSAHASVSPLQATWVAHTSPLRNPNPVVPAASRNASSWPPRPWRPSRLWTPCSRVRRIGRRSRLHRPLKSRSSVARAGTGSTTAARPMPSDPRPRFSTRCRSRRTPVSVSSSSVMTATDAAASTSSQVRVDGALSSRRTSPASSSRGAASAPAAAGPSAPAASRNTWSAGRPLQPSPNVGSRLSRSGSSIEEGGTEGTEARARELRAASSSAPRSAPQCSTAGTPVPRASTTTLTPAARR